MERKYLLGNEAIAHACIEAGVDFVSGYPGTPSSLSMCCGHNRNDPTTLNGQ